MKITKIKPFALLLFCSTPAMAADISIDFTATIKESTCSMKISGGAGTDSHQILTIGSNGAVGLDQIISGTATADFKITATNCSTGTSKISTKITGTASGSNVKLLIPQTGTSTTSNIGAAFSRKNNTSQQFTLNADGQIIWTKDEIANGLELTTVLAETTAGKGTTGDFNATATFSFSYE